MIHTDKSYSMSCDTCIEWLVRFDLDIKAESFSWPDKEVMIRAAKERGWSWHLRDVHGDQCPNCRVDK